MFESDGTHNSVQALINRHFEMGDEDFGLAFYKENSLDDYKVYLDSTAGLLMDATTKIHERLKSGCKENVSGLNDELSLLRDAYTD